MAAASSPPRKGSGKARSTRASAQVKLDVLPDLSRHSGRAGKNADHSLSVSFCNSASSNYLVLEKALWGYLCDEWLLIHDERESKDGPAMIFAEMRDRRSDKHCISVSALAYEIDGKLSLDETVERVQNCGSEAVLWTTANHMRTSQSVACREFQKWHIKTFGREATPTNETAARFCKQHKRYNHLCDVRLRDEGSVYYIRAYGKDIPVFAISHLPEHKLRIVFPLSTPIAMSGDCSVESFKALYHARGKELFGDNYSTESCNPARLHYLPAHKPGQPYSTLHFPGILTDPSAIFVAAGSARPRRSKAEKLAFKSATVAELARVLEGVPADLDYPDWFKALAAIFNETGGSGDGNELAHCWSSGDCRYDFDQVERIWDSFDPNYASPSTMGTLIALAREHDPNFKLSTVSMSATAIPMPLPSVGSDWRRQVKKSSGV